MLPPVITFLAHPIFLLTPCHLPTSNHDPAVPPLNLAIILLGCLQSIHTHRALDSLSINLPCQSFLIFHFEVRVLLSDMLCISIVALLPLIVVSPFRAITSNLLNGNMQRMHYSIIVHKFLLPTHSYILYIYIYCILHVSYST